MAQQSTNPETLNVSVEKDKSLCDNSIIDIHKLSTKFGIIEAEESNLAENCNKINVMSTIMPQNLNHFK